MRTRRPLSILATALLAAAAVACTPQAAQAPTPAPITVDTTEAAAGIVVGEGPVEIWLWTDPSCPHCALLDEAIGDDLTTLIDDGEVTLTLHPMTYVSAKRGDDTDYSTRAAAVLFAAAEDTAAIPALYALIQQNQVSDAGAPTDDDLLAYAREAGVSRDLRPALADAALLAQASNDAWLGETVPGTTQVVDHVPLLVIDGAVFEVREDGSDAARFADAVATARAAHR
ncbi:thioredoxin domain-containing protein [Microbacterium sp. NPDC089189]|uniref:DsbA family protein n=1 Tax=Microbacterium sp. NPDC089189 TaxID=3154972 RepID=UPI003421B18B